MRCLFGYCCHGCCSANACGSSPGFWLKGAVCKVPFCRFFGVNTYVNSPDISCGYANCCGDDEDDGDELKMSALLRSLTPLNFLVLPTPFRWVLSFFFNIVKTVSYMSHQRFVHIFTYQTYLQGGFSLFSEDGKQPCF